MIEEEIVSIINAIEDEDINKLSELIGKCPEILSPLNKSFRIDLMVHSISQVSLNSLRFFLEFGFDPNERSNGVPMATLAVLELNFEAAEILIEYGADVKLLTSNGDTMLSKVIRTEFLNIPERFLWLLKEKGYNPKDRLSVNNSDWGVLGTFSETAQNLLIEVFGEDLETEFDINKSRIEGDLEGVLNALSIKIMRMGISEEELENYQVNKDINTAIKLAIVTNQKELAIQLIDSFISQTPEGFAKSRVTILKGLVNLSNGDTSEENKNLLSLPYSFKGGMDFSNILIYIGFQHIIHLNTSKEPFYRQKFLDKLTSLYSSHDISNQFIRDIIISGEIKTEKDIKDYMRNNAMGSAQKYLLLAIAYYFIGDKLNGEYFLFKAKDHSLNYNTYSIKLEDFLLSLVVEEIINIFNEVTVE